MRSNQFRSWLVTMTLFVVAFGVAACGESGTPTSDYVDREEQHFQDCLDAGGSYEHEDTSAGEHWSCTLPSGKKEQGTL